MFLPPEPQSLTNTQPSAHTQRCYEQTVTMATGNITGNDNQRPECEVCLEFLDTGKHLPLSLDCRHDVCRACAQSILRGSEIVCPTCRHPTDVPEGDVSKLHKNYSLIKMIEKLCFNCGNLWSCQCLPCKTNICRGCSKLHTKAHKLNGRIEDAINLAIGMEVQLDKVQTDITQYFDDIIAAARQAQEKFLAELHQVREANRKEIKTWQDSLPATLTTEAKQLTDKLTNLFMPDFNQQLLKNVEHETSAFMKKLNDVKFEKTFLLHYIFEIHNDLRSAIADCATLKTAANYSQATFKHEVGGEGEDIRKFNGPWDVCQLSSGNFVVSVAGNDICQMLDPQLKLFSTFSSHLNQPAGVATDSQGLVYVASRGNHTIEVFSQHGQHKYSFGSHGSNPGQFIFPRGLAFDSNDHLYVCDRDNNRVQVVTCRGNYVRTLTVTGAGAGQLRNKPHTISVSQVNRIVITDCLEDGEGGNVYIYDTSGNHITTLLRGRDTFGEAKGTVSDSFGHLLVADHKTGCICVFNKSLKRMCKFGVKGRGHGQLWEPHSLALTQDGHVIVLDWGNFKVVLYEIPKFV